MKLTIFSVLFLATTALFSQAEINVRISDFRYEETMGTYGSMVFDVELEQGSGYDTTGGLYSSNLRWNIYMEPGVAIDKAGVTTINDGVFNISEFSFQNTTMPVFTPTAPSGFSTEIIPTMIKRTQGEPELPETYQKVGSVVMPLTSTSAIPTGETFVTLRSSPEYAEAAVNASSWSSHNGYSKQIFTYSQLENPLPVKLLGFFAHCVDAGVWIAWQTASEINNDYFTVERSIDGYNFTSIGKISGAGNSTVPLSYSFTDNYNTLTNVTYYRLKQTDFNGDFEYFDPVAVKCDDFEISPDYTIYPNPATSFINLQFTNDLVPTGEVEIYNTLGMIMSRLPVSNLIDVSFLSPGIYYIKLNTGLYTFPVKKFEKRQL